MSNCDSCNGTGYIKSHIAKDASIKPLVVKCPNPNCPNESKYYQYIKDKYSLSLEEQVLPTKDFVPEPKPTQIDIKIPSELLNQPNELANIINKEIQRQAPMGQPGTQPNNPNPNLNNPETNVSNPKPNLNNPETSVSSPRAKGTPGTSQAPQSQLPGKVEMDTQYPHLPKAMVQQFNKYKDQEEMAGIQLNTPFGVLSTRDLGFANRVTGIVQSYQKHTDSLDLADSLDNVTIFPLDKSLGL